MFNDDNRFDRVWKKIDRKNHLRDYFLGGIEYMMNQVKGQTRILDDDLTFHHVKMS